jgi:hypothetical protein
LQRKIYAPDCACVGVGRRVNLPKSSLRTPSERRRIGAADDAEAFHPCGNECSYARFVFFSHVSRMGASDAIGRFLD